MSGAEISLLAVVAAFTGLLAWVYWPGNRGRLESYGSIPLDDDVESAAARGSRRVDPAREEER